MLQSLTVEILHYDEALPVVFANFVDGADVGMIERGGSASFAAEAFQCMRVLRQIVRKELQRNKTPEFGVLGLIYHAHSTATELFDDAVMRNSAAEEGILTGRSGLSRVNLMGQASGRDLHRGRFEEAVVFLVLRQKQFHGPAQRLILAAGLLQKSTPRALFLVQSGITQALDFLPTLRLHPSSPRSVRNAANSWPSSSRTARFHWIASGLPAVSSRLKEPQHEAQSRSKRKSAQMREILSETAFGFCFPESTHASTGTPEPKFHLVRQEPINKV